MGAAEEVNLTFSEYIIWENYLLHTFKKQRVTNRLKDPRWSNEL